MPAKSAPVTGDASKHITNRIEQLGGWRGATLARIRQLIHDADPEVVEAWKWMGTPVWEHDGGICTGESYKEVVKLTFFHGAALPDPKQLFNSSLEGGTRRAIDIREGEKLDEAAFKKLIKAAVAVNTAVRAAKKRPAAKKPAAAKAKPAAAKKQPAAAKKSAAKKPAAKTKAR